jgi:hypothetical protein
MPALQGNRSGWGARAPRTKVVPWRSHDALASRFSIVSCLPEFCSNFCRAPAYCGCSSAHRENLIALGNSCRADATSASPTSHLTRAAWGHAVARWQAFGGCRASPWRDRAGSGCAESRRHGEPWFCQRSKFSPNRLGDRTSNDSTKTGATSGPTLTPRAVRRPVGFRSWVCRPC